MSLIEKTPFDFDTDLLELAQVQGLRPYQSTQQDVNHLSQIEGKLWSGKQAMLVSADNGIKNIVDQLPSNVGSISDPSSATASDVAAKVNELIGAFGALILALDQLDGINLSGFAFSQRTPE